MTPGSDWYARAAEHLEWPRLRDAILARCRSPSARRTGLPIAQTRPEALGLLAETRELCGLLQRGEPPPLSDLRDVEPHLARLARHGVLDAPALCDLQVTLRNAREVRRFLGSQRETLPALHAACTADPSLDELEQQLQVALEPEGRLADRASAELASLRTEIANLRARIVGRLEQLIGRYEAVLSDRYYTVREGRYVLPVRRDAHEKVPGIVHAESSSGASIFVEPRAVVAQGNRLKMAEAQALREELRILAELSDLVRERLPEVGAAASALDRLDLRHAAALVGQQLGGHVPDLSERASIQLREARHPLLALEGVDVVPNDLALDGSKGIVISGPNAGGKTVLLKTLGLAALMVRHGLPVAAAEGSQVGFFDRVLTDLGDEQSTATNLSTFSAHVRNLAAILEQADESSLVLLDEVATGTDPGEGGALACAVVEAICDKRAALAVTTHYEPLKAMSMQDDRLRSASVGFDAEHMRPSFELMLDVPGASSALLVAARFGIPSSVIAAAQRVLPEQSSRFEALVRELSAQKQELSRREHELELAERRARTLEDEAKQRLQRLRAQGDEQIRNEVEQLRRDVRAARDEVDRASKALRDRAAKATEVAASKKAIDAVASRLAIGGDLEQPTESAKPSAKSETSEAVEVERIREGLAVYVPHLRSEAVVLEGPAKGRTRVAAGPLKLWVRNEELRMKRADESSSSSTSADRRGATEAPLARDEARGSDNTLNVRGMRVDDALGMLESFVDRMYMDDLRVGYILHGHGTGALRDAVRRHLRESIANVSNVGPAQASDGGDAVTVFHLA